MRHNIIHRFLNTLAAVGMALGAVSCGDEGSWSSLDPGIGQQPDAEKPTEVTLRLKVSVPGDSPQTRAYPDKDDGSFEDPATEYEKLHTLRVIIADKTSGKVDHNRVVNLDGDGNIINDNLEFRIQLPTLPVNGVNLPQSLAAKKTVWLFGNEKAADEAVCAALMSGGFTSSEALDRIHSKGGLALDLMAPGITLPEEILRRVELTRPDNAPFIDNSVADVDKGLIHQYIPMNEVFEVTVDPTKAIIEEGKDVYTQTEHMFLTRSLVKFTFSATIGSSIGSDSWSTSISDITIDKIARAGYLIPNATVYDPGKEIVAEGNGARTILDFKAPGNTVFEFHPTGFKVLREAPVAGAANVYDTFMYFPETAVAGNDGFYVSVKTVTAHSDGTPGDEKSYGPVKLPLLPQLPRNTHVYVNFKFNPGSVTCQVDVLPYTGVWLEPGFGIDRE